MTPNSETPKDATALVEAYEDSTLFSHIFNRFGYADETEVASILSICVSLHNAEAIDLLSLTKCAEFEKIDPGSFFMGQHLLCEAIPKLAASTIAMISFVNDLVEKGGADLMASTPNAAFREWCKVNPTRSQDVIGLADNGNREAAKVLSFALNAENNIEAAKAFAENYSDERRLAAITALSRMTFESSESARDAISTLNSVLDGSPGDFPTALIVSSTLEIIDKKVDLSWDRSLDILGRACKASGPQTHFACARALWVHQRPLSDEVVCLLLDTLLSLDRSHKGTIKELDHGLYKLLDTANADLAIRFLADLLNRASDGSLSLSDFPMLGSALLDGPTDRFQRVFVSWLLSGSQVLCEGLEKLLTRKGRGEKPIDLATIQANLTPTQQIFLCRKAIGYFFIEPVIATSVLVSILRECDEKTAQSTRDLLIDPLLRNYGGATRDYLKTIDSEDPSYANVDFALKQHEQYIQDLNSAPQIKELQPSEHQRQIENVRFHDQMKIAQKSAMKESVLLNLVRRSVILFGTRTMTYVEGPNNERRAVEMDMKSHGISMEIPRRDIIDPVGLELMLRMFRAERLES